MSGVGGGSGAPGPTADEVARDALHAASRRLASGVEEVAGGAGLRAGAVPLVPTGAVWSPDPARLEEVAAFAEREGGPPAVCLAPGDPVEDALREAGYRPVAGVALDADVEAREDAPEGGPVAWDRAAEAAAAIAADVLPEEDADREALAEALAALLAAAVADDEAMRIELGGDADARAAALVYEDARAALVVLSGGPAERIVHDALATARGLGKGAWRLRQTGPEAEGVVLRRWERPE